MDYEGNICGISNKGVFVNEKRRTSSKTRQIRFVKNQKHFKKADFKC